jgi:hypothetical protein
MDLTTPKRTILSLTAIALLALPATAVSGGKDYGKDYATNAATGEYFGSRYTDESDAARRNRQVSPYGTQFVTVAKPGGFDWSDAAIGAGVGVAVAGAISGLGLTAVLRRRRIGPTSVAR